MTAPFMAKNDGYKLLDQLAYAGVEKVNFLGGKPMLRPHIEALIIYAAILMKIDFTKETETGVGTESLLEVKLNGL